MVAPLSGTTLTELFESAVPRIAKNLKAEAEFRDDEAARAFDEYFNNPSPGKALRTVQGCHFVYPKVAYDATDANPYMVCYSDAAGSYLGLCKGFQNSPSFLSIFSGGTATPSSEPAIATVYGCHCGSTYFGQMGDGRVVTILETPDCEVQLKGSAQTPFSRGFDGKAALRGCVREMLGSEGLAGLGVPTQRVLSVVGTGRSVSRPWYKFKEPLLSGEE